jgi:hypothetical protein
VTDDFAIVYPADAPMEQFNTCETAVGKLTDWDVWNCG